MAEPFETMVRVYKETKDYQKDQSKLAKDGWTTATMVERKPRAGIGRIATLGVMSVVRPPKPELVVTYQRLKPSKGKPKAMAQGGHCPKCGVSVSGTATFCSNCGQKLRA